MTHRRRHRLAIRTAAIAALALTLPPAIRPTAARADSTITHLWSQPLRETNQLIVGPTGGDIGIDENCDWAGGDTAYQDFTADGSQHWALSNSGNQQPWCGADSFIDATGNTYLYMHDGPADTGNGQRLSSYDATGALRWTDLVTGGGGGVQRFAMGFDGNLYALYDYNKVLRVNPITGSGLTMGYIQDIGSDTTLTTYSGGLVVGGYGSARGYNYGGTNTWAMNVDPSVSTGPITFGVGGGTYMSGCTATGLGGVTFARPLPSTHWTWFEPLASSAGCGSVRIASTPDGGAVVSIMNQDDTKLTYYGISPNGGSRWTHVITPPGGASPFYSYMYAQPVADFSGTVVLPSEFTTSGALCVNNQCPDARIEFVNQATGAQTYSPVDLPANTVSPQIAITAGRLYAADQSWISAIGSLDAYAVPGLGNDYQTSLEPQLAAGARIAAPAQSDALLTRQLQINLSVGSTPAASYQYGWLPPGTVGTPTPTQIQLCFHPSGACTLNYAPTTPDQSGWKLIVRGIAGTNVGPWVYATGPDGSTNIEIPSTPVLIALGDSVSAGHHYVPTLLRVECEDPDYAYPAYVWKRLESSLPSQWQGSGYYNYAVSGFTTTQILNGARNPNTGKTDPSNGKDACGNSVYSGTDTPIANAQAILHGHQASWVRVVITGGINDTDWGKVITQIGTHSDLGLNPLYSVADCSADMNSWPDWPGGTSNARATVKANVQEIMSDLLSSKAGDQSARIFWVGYYNVAPGYTYAPPVPKTCNSPFAVATQTLNSTIQSALADSPHTWVDTYAALSFKPILIQPFTALDTYNALHKVANSPSGWPHPNKLGALWISGLINPS